jgi:hypothetical protein
MFLGVASFAVGVLGQDTPLGTQIEQLIRQLNAPEATARDAAERDLIQLGSPGNTAAGTPAVLKLLPEPNDRMPPEVRHRLTRIRQTIEQADAEATVAASQVTLQADEMPLPEVFSAIEKQTGNRILDQREQFGQEAMQAPLTIQIEKEAFWPAFDKILDAAQLTAYTFSGEDALIVRPREPNAHERSGQAYYTGPFRIAATQVHATRDLRSEGGDSLRVTVEIAWEPRLRPIRISHPLDSLVALDEDGNSLTGTMSTGELEVPVNIGNQAAELQLALRLPPRSTETIARLAGKLSTVIPGRTETFRFENLAGAAEVEQRRGGATVTLDRVRKSGSIWELHMRVRFDETSGALESHRGWVLQNLSYLVGPDGTPIEHVGFETTHQSEQELGLAYLFELPEGRDSIQGLAWEYQSPAAIIPLPIEYELKDIRLP